MLRIGLLVRAPEKGSIRILAYVFRVEFLLKGPLRAL